MFDNLDDENHDNVNYQEKEQLKKYEKKGKKTTRKNVNNQKKQHIKIEGSKIKKTNRDNFDTNEKFHLKKYGRKTKINNRLQHLDKRNSIFNNVQMCSMVDPSILTIPVFRLNEEDFETANQESPTYICDICWKFKF